MENNKVTYLQMIQEIIARLSNIAPIIKGFSITVTMAAITLIGNESLGSVIKCSFIAPMLALCILDVYYLHLERKYRCLYEAVRNNDRPVDFSLKITSDIDTSSVTIWKVLSSKCVLLFYLPLFIVYFLCINISMN